MLTKFSPPRNGFALVATLAVIVIVAILLVAFSTTMRTERQASENFADRDRAEAIGTGMLHRILAEHAAPEINGEPLQPFEVNDGFDGTPPTGLPTRRTAEDYYAAVDYSERDGPVVPIPNADERSELQPIYQMVPDDQDLFERTGLIRVSKPKTGSGEVAYDAKFWAYDGLADIPTAVPETTPEWINYYQPDDPQTTDNESLYPVAQVAFAIWEEGGKFDVNQIGEDPSVNGIAPHNLKIEETLSPGGSDALTQFLNNNNQKRDRNNFSLRNVVSVFPEFRAGTSATNDEGDDRQIFSVRELVERNLIDPTKIRLLTTYSRDFDVRPEWDGDRAPKALREDGALLGSEDFLRSYINNPALYGLFYGAGGAGPYLVYNTLNNQELSDRLLSEGSSLQPSPGDSDEDKADWMQVMRLLAVLRRSLSPYMTTEGQTRSILSSPSEFVSTKFEPNRWSPFDVWGIGQNIIQASATPSDYNLVAFNPRIASQPYNDPNVRVGIKLSPLIVEATLKVKRLNTAVYTLTNYIKIWNPYPFSLQGVRYRVGVHTNSAWPGSDNDGLFPMTDRRTRAEGIPGPAAGQFLVIQMENYVSAASITDAMSKSRFQYRLRPFLQEMDFSSGTSGTYKVGGSNETPYVNLGMPGYYANNRNDPNQLLLNMRGTDAMGVGAVRWFSFQIDDPRMGSIRRNVNFYGTVPPYDQLTDVGWPNQNLPDHKWSWILYPKHALAGVQIFRDYGDGNPRPVVDGDISPSAADYYPRSFNVNGTTTLGFNKNFGINWPGAGPEGVTDQETFNKMMSTFALPGRPLLNIGEIGTVFAMRPWTTLNFADKIIPDAAGEVNPPVEAPTSNEALLRPAAILDYFTTIGTPESFDYDNYADSELRYMDPTNFNSGYRPEPGTFSFTNMEKRYQDKGWLFESLTSGSSIEEQVPNGNLRPIRGRVNLNTASKEVLVALLKAPYRMPKSLGLMGMGATDINDRECEFTVDAADADAMASAIVTRIDSPQAIRPLRMLSDLSQLYDKNPGLMSDLYSKYPQSVITAMIGRLAQFGTVRQQAYTVDMVIRTLNPEAEKQRLSSGSGSTRRAVTGETRLQARVFFDTFSRKAFIESMQLK